MIGGLIQQEEGRGIREEEGQFQPSLLTHAEVEEGTGEVTGIKETQRSKGNVVRYLASENVHIRLHGCSGGTSVKGIGDVEFLREQTDGTAPFREGSFWRKWRPMCLGK